jgi:hypothetical protein
MKLVSYNSTRLQTANRNIRMQNYGKSPILWYNIYNNFVCFLLGAVQGTGKRWERYNVYVSYIRVTQRMEAYVPSTRLYGVSVQKTHNTRINRQMPHSSQNAPPLPYHKNN